jgi:hypothetical protein
MERHLIRPSPQEDGIFYILLQVSRPILEIGTCHFTKGVTNTNSNFRLITKLFNSSRSIHTFPYTAPSYLDIIPNLTKSKSLCEAIPLSRPTCQDGRKRRHTLVYSSGSFRLRGQQRHYTASYEQSSSAQRHLNVRRNIQDIQIGIIFISFFINFITRTVLSEEY